MVPKWCPIKGEYVVFSVIWVWIVKWIVPKCEQWYPQRILCWPEITLKRKCKSGVLRLCMQYDNYMYVQ